MALTMLKTVNLDLQTKPWQSIQNSTVPPPGVILGYQTLPSGCLSTRGTAYIIQYVLWKTCLKLRVGYEELEGCE